MTNHSLVLAAMLFATLSTATSYLLEYPTIPEPCGSSYRDRQTIAFPHQPFTIFSVAGVYGKDHQNYGTAFFLVLSVVNLCDYHNPLVLLEAKSRKDKSCHQGHRWNTEETREDPVRVEYSGAGVRWCVGLAVLRNTLWSRYPAQHFKCHLMD